MTSPTILTIILNYKTPDMTLKAAEAVVGEMAALKGEVVIVDNDSRDGSFEHLSAAVAERQWAPLVRVVGSGHNGGFGAGNNFGMRQGLSNGDAPDYYYLLNSDAFPEPGAVRQLRDFLVDNPGAGLVGSYVHGVDGTPHRTAFRFPSIAGEFEAAARTGIFSRLLKHSIVAMEMPQQETQVDWTAGASLILSRRMLEDVGGFDETFFLYFEETELCLRAARAGWRTHYLPASRVAHVGSASTGMKTWARTPSYWFDSRLYFFTKTQGALYAAGATLALTCGALLWRLRLLLSKKTPADPPHFLRDLLAHYLRALATSRPRSSQETRLTHPASEDFK